MCGVRARRGGLPRRKGREKNGEKHDAFLPKRLTLRLSRFFRPPPTFSLPNQSSNGLCPARQRRGPARPLVPRGRPPPGRRAPVSRFGVEGRGGTFGTLCGCIPSLCRASEPGAHQIGVPAMRRGGALGRSGGRVRSKHTRVRERVGSRRFFRGAPFAPPRAAIPRPTRPISTSAGSLASGGRASEAVNAARRGVCSAVGPASERERVWPSTTPSLPHTAPPVPAPRPRAPRSPPPRPPSRSPRSRAWRPRSAARPR